ncbi:carbohydrate ABC transporter permease [Stackebrandtia nassauensis]|uniref:Binding-protein-dependent transport systems inner membrane component n=1 Tax=Stackebrandtia nassauensis (strain DSM 44728 / CIP 108903 / NRRL B-16338 / NBRC 102104 / LLR-40K-21) TaxID=446470 RepID=D3QA40_STANL|nr:sugar ABC transporter permease [Stackebrandtia nassauensis]ADD40752.1 binding-protein-dependent transport systems inner membrane component [Stackebrandtia nassauensis DSM 44728]
MTTDVKAAERRLGLWLCAPAAAFMLLVAGWPILYSVILSFKRYDLRFPDDQAWVGFSNYATVLTNEFWWTSFGVTMIITVVSVAFELVLGMALAQVMYRTLVAKGLLRTVVLIPYGIVTVVAAFGWFYAWTPGTGWLAAMLPDGEAPLTEFWPAIGIIILAEVWKTTPFMALLLLAGLAIVPEELHRAAAMDGAGRWQRFVRITLPLMRPAIAVALLFRILDAFRIYDNIYVLTKGSQSTGSVSILTYRNLVSGLNLGIGSTMSVLIFITVAIIAFFFVTVLKTGTPGQGGR